MTQRDRHGATLHTNVIQEKVKNLFTTDTQATRHRPTQRPEEL